MRDISSNSADPYSMKKAGSFGSSSKFMNGFNITAKHLTKRAT